MDVEIFRRTVKDRRRGASWELLQHMAEGIRACGDNPIMVNEHKTGDWTPNEMEPTAKIGCMFGYGGTNQMHHTKGRRRDLVERAKKKGIYIIQLIRNNELLANKKFPISFSEKTLRYCPLTVLLPHRPANPNVSNSKSSTPL